MKRFSAYGKTGIRFTAVIKRKNRLGFSTKTVFLLHQGPQIHEEYEATEYMKIDGIIPISIAGMLILFSCQRTTPTQEGTQMVRMAKLVVDSTHLETYKALLKEEIEASVRLEPGVLTLYAVSEKDHPTHITILEIYADTSAYKAHLQTPHFIKYKTGTKEMVKSLELVESDPLVPGMKIK